MTVETEDLSGLPIVKSGPYNGNGVTAAFNYDFQIQAETELLVTRQNADLTEDTLTLTTDYTVSGVGADAGGSITLVDPATDLPTGAKLVITYAGDYNQTVDYSNQGAIQLGLLEDSLDKMTMHLRSLKELVDRSVKVDSFDTVDLDTLTANLSAVAAIATEVATVAGISANVTTVAGISANVTTVAGISANVTTVAGISANVTTVAGLAADIATVVANMLDIQNAEENAAAAAASAAAAAASETAAAASAAAAAASATAAAAAVGSVKVSSNDTTPGDLEQKLTVGTGLSLSTVNDGADEDRKIDLSFASQAEAEAGTDDTKPMNPLRTAQAIAALASSAEEFLSSVDLANDAVVDFTLSAAYDYHKFVFVNVVPATDNVNFGARTSADGGSTFDSGVSDYNWSWIGSTSSNAGVQILGDSADTKIDLSYLSGATGVGSGAGEDGLSGVIYVLGHHLAKQTRVEGKTVYTDASGVNRVMDIGAARLSAAVADAIRFFFSSGNLESGTITHIGGKNA